MGIDGATVAFSRAPHALEGRFELGWGDCSVKGRCLGWGECDFQRGAGYSKKGAIGFRGLPIAIDLKMRQL